MFPILWLFLFIKVRLPLDQGLVKGEKFCFRNLDFFLTWRDYFYSHPTHFSSSQESKDLNKVSLLLQDLDLHQLSVSRMSVKEKEIFNSLFNVLGLHIYPWFVYEPIIYVSEIAPTSWFQHKHILYHGICEAPDFVNGD